MFLILDNREKKRGYGKDMHKKYTNRFERRIFIFDTLFTQMYNICESIN